MNGSVLDTHRIRPENTGFVVSVDALHQLLLHFEAGLWFDEGLVLQFPDLTPFWRSFLIAITRWTGLDVGFQFRHILATQTRTSPREASGSLRTL
jgi:hypothetical protein